MFLGPWDTRVNGVILYSLAHAAQRYGVQEHHFVEMMNHIHLIATMMRQEGEALGGKFLHEFHFDVNKTLNVLLASQGGGDPSVTPHHGREYGSFLSGILLAIYMQQGWNRLSAARQLRRDVYHKTPRKSLGVKDQIHPIARQDFRIKFESKRCLTNCISWNVGKCTGTWASRLLIPDCLHHDCPTSYAMQRSGCTVNVLALYPNEWAANPVVL